MNKVVRMARNIVKVAWEKLSVGDEAKGARKTLHNLCLKIQEKHNN